MNDIKSKDHFLLHNCFGLPLEQVFDLLPVGVFLIDKNHQYVFNNSKKATIHGKPKDELLGKKPYDFFPDLKDSLSNIFKHVFTTQEPVINHEIECNRTPHQQNNGNTFANDTFYWSACFFHQWDKEHNEQYILCTIEDITDLKHAEFHLSNQNQELHAMVEDRTKELKQKQKKLLQASRMMADREQDIKRNLAEKIHGNLQQLLVGASIKANKLQRIIDNQNHLKHVEELVYFLKKASEEARAVSHQLSPPVLEHASFNQALDWLANWAKDTYGLNVKLNLDPEGDKLDERTKYYLFDSINELILNCVKHANTDTAFITSKLLANEKLLISVTDFGTGCYIYELWNHDEEDTSHFGITNFQKRLEVMGCSVHFWSEPGKGFQTKIYIPTEKLETTEGVLSEGFKDVIEEQDVASIQKPTSAYIETKKILIVDDHEMIREGIISLLEDEIDLEVIGEAENGINAISMVQTHQPDVVMMDVNMPKMDGIEATRAIISEYPNIKIIGLSVNNDQTTRKAMLDAGAVDYIAKDNTSEELCELIRNLK